MSSILQSNAPVTASVTVYSASFAALLGALAMGLALGYSSPAFFDMDRDKSSVLDPDPVKRETEKSWFGSVLAIGALCGGILAEPSNKILGRRLSLIIFGVPFTIGWVCIAAANGITMLIFGRLLIGLCCGLVSGIAPSYVVEISPPAIRGFLGTCFQVMVTIGILMAAVFGMYVSWSMLAWISTVAAVGMSCLMFAMPETPQWLLSKNREAEAKEGLARLRATPIQEEFAMLSLANSNAHGEGTSSSYSWETISKREFYKPLVLAIGLMFFQQFSGINAVLFYQTDIFKKVAPKLDAQLATTLVCLAQVFATVGGSLLVDRLGRKVLLLLSGIGHAVSLTLFGVYNHFKDDPDFEARFAWVALFSLILFISSFSLGFGPIPWMMIPELSSASVRSLVASIATVLNWTFVFIVTRYVKSLIDGVGDDWAYWIFAIICALSCVFVFLSLIETKGRTPEQIQSALLGGPRPNEATNLVMTS